MKFIYYDLRVLENLTEGFYYDNDPILINLN